MKLDVEPLDVPVSSRINLKRHFSIDRGVLNVQETVLEENQIGLVNLPADVTRGNIIEYLGSVDNSIDVSIKYCALGLPAYATVTFKNKEEVKKAK